MTETGVRPVPRDDPLEWIAQNSIHPVPFSFNPTNPTESLIHNASNLYTRVSVSILNAFSHDQVSPERFEIQRKILNHTISLIAHHSVHYTSFLEHYLINQVNPHVCTLYFPLLISFTGFVRWVMHFFSAAVTPDDIPLFPISIHFTTFLHAIVPFLVVSPNHTFSPFQLDPSARFLFQHELVHLPYDPMQHAIVYGLGAASLLLVGKAAVTNTFNSFSLVITTLVYSTALLFCQYDVATQAGDFIFEFFPSETLPKRPLVLQLSVLHALTGIPYPFGLQHTIETSLSYPEIIQPAMAAMDYVVQSLAQQPSPDIYTILASPVSLSNPPGENDTQQSNMAPSCLYHYLLPLMSLCHISQEHFFIFDYRYIYFSPYHVRVLHTSRLNDHLSSWLNNSTAVFTLSNLVTNPFLFYILHQLLTVIFNHTASITAQQLAFHLQTPNISPLVVHLHALWSHNHAIVPSISQLSCSPLDIEQLNPQPFAKLVRSVAQNFHSLDHDVPQPVFFSLQTYQQVEPQLVRDLFYDFHDHVQEFPPGYHYFGPRDRYSTPAVIENENNLVGQLPRRFQYDEPQQHSKKHAPREREHAAHGSGLMQQVSLTGEPILPDNNMASDVTAPQPLDGDNQEITQPPVAAAAAAAAVPATATSDGPTATATSNSPTTTATSNKPTATTVHSRLSNQDIQTAFFGLPCASNIFTKASLRLNRQYIARRLPTDATIPKVSQLLPELNPSQSHTNNDDMAGHELPYSYYNPVAHSPSHFALVKLSNINGENDACIIQVIENATQTNILTTLSSQLITQQQQFAVSTSQLLNALTPIKQTIVRAAAHEQRGGF